MIKIKDNGKVIDLKNLPNTFEIPIEDIFNYNKTNTEKIKNQSISFKDNKKTLNFDELNLKDTSAAIKYNYLGNSILININGPRECRYREKMKNEACMIEVYTKFNIETKKEKSKILNDEIINFCESVVFTTEYPKCQINISINILSSNDETSLYSSILNGIMLCLSISGISIKIFSLSGFYLNSSCNLRVILSLDANNLKNILSINSKKPLKKEEYKSIINKIQEEIRELYDEYKKIMLKKIAS